MDINKLRPGDTGGRPAAGIARGLYQAWPGMT